MQQATRFDAGPVTKCHVNFYHKTVPYRTPQGKTVRVDAKILPVVKWLNSIPKVETRFSCQGTPPNIVREAIKARRHISMTAYVLFECRKQQSLKNIVTATKGFGTVEVHVMTGSDILRYYLRFNNVEALHLFKRSKIT